MLRHALAAAGLAAGTVSCGSSGGGSPGGGAAAECGAGDERVGEDCLLRRDACAPNAVPIPGGGCLSVGATAAGCAAGFVDDGDGGCVPTLPPEACMGATFAVPGDAACRPLLECGDGTWGDVPTNADTVHVDASYGGGDSDGSAARPFSSLVAALAIAQGGDLVALAAGTYAGNLVITERLRLWGRCPELVTVEGRYLAEDDQDALGVVGADGVEIRGVTLTAPGAGLLAYEATNLLVEATRFADSVWGILAAGDVSVMSVTVRDSLFTDLRSTGVLGLGAEVVVERSELRAARPSAQEDGVALFTGRFSATSPEPTLRATAVRVTGHVSAAIAMSSPLLIEESSLSGFVPGLDGKSFGGVTAILDAEAPQPSDVTVRSSVIDGAFAVGVAVGGGSLLLDRAVVRGTRTGSAVEDSIGAVAAFADGDEGATARIVDSTLAGNVGVGLLVGEGEAVVERSIVRDGVPHDSTGEFGRGISVEGVQRDARLELVDSLVEGCHEAAVAVIGAGALLDGTAIRRTTASLGTGLYGDGLVVATGLGPRLARAEVRRSIVDGSARAGATVLGGELVLSDTRLSCSAFDLDVEDVYGTDEFGSRLTNPVILTDSGGNSCGCEPTRGRCQASSNGLTAAPPPSRPSLRR